VSLPADLEKKPSRSGAKEAAEKGIDLKEETEKHPSGAKAQLILQGLCTG
jgi:hypothetical protein